MSFKYPFVAEISGLGEVKIYKGLSGSYTIIVNGYGGGPIVRKNSVGDWEVYQGGSYSRFNQEIDRILKSHEEELMERN